VEIFRNSSGGANGTLIDRQGRLLVCEATTRRITRTEPDGRITILADTYQGKKFNSPNDLSIDSKGRIFFTDPRYGKRDSMEMSEEGVYRIDEPGKVVRIIASEVQRPNGILVSPDDRFLYVADNNNNQIGGARKLWRFNLTPEGNITPDSRKLIFDWHTARGPDGFKMDSEGRLFVAAGLNKPHEPYETVEGFKAGVFILSAEGKLIEFVPIPRDEVTNCAFGGDDLKTLFITAGGSLYSVRVKAPGRITAGSERQAAEWIIGQGGRVMLDDGRRPISKLAELPSTEFRITGVDLMGTIIEPKQLEQISGLRHVKELYLPGASWTPGSGSKLDANDALKYLAGMKHLERLQFSLHFLPYFNVTDAAFQYISGLTQLQELRCSQCRLRKGGLTPYTNLHSLDLSYSTFGDESMASVEGMHHLKRLNLRDTLVTDKGLQYIAGLTQLEELDLYGTRVTDQGIAHLKNLTGLRKLNISGAPITDESLPVLAGMSKLRELNMYRSRITNSGLAMLSKLTELKMVDLRYSRVTASGIETFRAAVPACDVEFAGALSPKSSASAIKPAGTTDKDVAAWVASLGGRVESNQTGLVRGISLASLPVGDAQLAYLTALENIEKLDLSGTEIGDAGLKRLQQLTKLQELNLGGTTVSDAGLAALTSLGRLRSLHLANTAVSGAGMKQLPLVDLDLSGCPVRNEGLSDIAQIATLERLVLSGTDITDAGLAHLAKLPKLTSLNLNSDDIGDEGLKHLAEHASLRELSLRFTRFTDKGVQHLKSLTQLQRLDLARTRTAAGALAVIGTMRELKALNLDYTSTNSKGLEALRALPNLQELSLILPT
jgi:Gluconolactonase